MITQSQSLEAANKLKEHDKDTGSTSVQIALLTARINHLSKHIESNKKDFSSRVGLLKLVGQRRRLLNYLGQNDPKKYKVTISELNLRK